MATASPVQNMISSSDVKDVSIYDRAGNHIGSIDHLMIEKERGRVRYAVVSFGGFVGLGHSHYPIPWNSFSYAPDVGGFVTDISDQQLRDAPEFSDDSWTSRDWERRVHSHYRVPEYWSQPSAGPAGIPPIVPDGGQLPNQGTTETTRATAATGTQLVSSEDVEGLYVFDRRDNSIGSVDHLIIDKRTGQVHFAVISFGGFLGLGQSHYPIPWDSLEYDPTLKGFRCGLTKDDLEDAPTFSDDLWQRPDWSNKVREHYARRAR